MPLTREDFKLRISEKEKRSENESFSPDRLTLIRMVREELIAHGVNPPADAIQSEPDGLKIDLKDIKDPKVVDNAVRRAVDHFVELTQEFAARSPTANKRR